MKTYYLDGTYIQYRMKSGILSFAQLVYRILCKCRDSVSKMEKSVTVYSPERDTDFPVGLNVYYNAELASLLAENLRFCSDIGAAFAAVAAGNEKDLLRTLCSQ